jgi:hypothetical protein
MQRRSPRQRAPRPVTHQWRKPRLEALEGRMMMAVSGFGFAAPPGAFDQVLAPPTAPNPGAVGGEIIVTHTGDNGVGSLRWALEQANASPGANRISFRLAAGGGNASEDADAALPGGDAAADVFVIRPRTALPMLSDTTGGTSIDGWSQAAFAGDTNPFGPEVVLDGAQLPGDNLSGIQIGINAHENRVLGLVIQNFPGNGISITRSNNNQIAGNYIGVDASGGEARPNGRTTQSSAGGILLSAGSKNNLIGTNGDGVNDEAEGNLIAGNRRHGVRIQQGAATDQTNGNAIRGNVIGAYGLGNGEHGVFFLGGAGGTGVSLNVVEHNLLVGNAVADVQQQSLSPTANVVRDNIDSQLFSELMQRSTGLTPQEFLAAAGAPVAEFDWSMEQRTGPAYVYDSDWADFPGQIPNVPEYVNPSAGYGVTLDGSQSMARGSNTLVSYSWTVVGKTDPTVRRQVQGVRPTLRLPEGLYQITLVVTDSAGQSQTAAGEIFVNDILIVSMGDSYASGEGNPHDKYEYGVWAVGGDPEATSRNQLAHRSIYSAPAQAAWLLEQNDPHTSVTFVSVASSGATTRHLLESQSRFDFEGHFVAGDYLFEGDTSLPGQISQVRALTRQGDSFREIDRLFLSAGGNDAGFTEIIEGLLKDDYSAFPSLPAKFSTLLATYQNLDDVIESQLPVDRQNIFLTGYPDPTSDASVTNTPLKMMDDVFDLAGVLGIINDVSYREIQLARNYVLAPLNATLAQAALRNQWQFVTQEKALWTHGYAAEENWVVTWDESVDRQGRDANDLPGIKTLGVMHPNELGSKAMAIRLANAAFGATFERGRQPAPYVTDITTRIEVAAPPPAGVPWAPQTINVYYSGSSTQFQTGNEVFQPRIAPVLFAANFSFNREIGPVDLRADDVALLGPGGAAAEILAVRYVGKSLYQIDFRPTGYGTYLLAIGPHTPDRNGRAMDQDGDGIGAYRSGAVQADLYFDAVVVNAPGSAPRGLPRSIPANPAVGVDANGDTLGSIGQYSTSTQTALPAGAMLPAFPSPSGGDRFYAAPSPWGISFSVATLNTFLRPTHAHESSHGLLDGALLGLPAMLGQAGYANRVSNTTSDNQERAALIAEEFLGFDIVALQEVFDPDQIRQFYQLATERGFYNLSGPGPDTSGWGPFTWSIGTGAGLALLVDRTLSSQGGGVWSDDWQRMLNGPSLNGTGLRHRVEDVFEHESRPFEYEGGRGFLDTTGKLMLDAGEAIGGVLKDESIISNKGFTVDTVQLGANPDHFVYVVNTHLSAEAGEHGTYTRLRQVSEIANFVDSQTDGLHPVVFLGDFNIAAGTSDYDWMMRRLGNPIDVFAATPDGRDFFTTDPRRNPYEYFERHTAQGDPAFLFSGQKRIDYILIRQGSEYAIRVNSVSLEDGTDSNPADLLTDRMRHWSQHPVFENYFSTAFDVPWVEDPGTLVPFISDHFGLSAQLVFGEQLGGPDVVDATSHIDVRSNLDSPPATQTFSWGVTSEFIEVTFDEPVDIRSFTASDVRLLSPKLQLAPILSVRPWTTPDDLLADSSPFSRPLPDALRDQRVGSDENVGPPPAKRFVIEFLPTTYGEYTLSLGPAINDLAGNPMTTVRHRAVTLRQSTGDRITTSLDAAPMSSPSDLPHFIPGPPPQKITDESRSVRLPGWATPLTSATLEVFVVPNDNPDLFAVQPAVDSQGTLTFTTKPNQSGMARVWLAGANGSVLVPGQSVEGGSVVPSDASALTIHITKKRVWHNAELREDVLPDGQVVGGDVLAIINHINAQNPGSVPTDGRSGGPYLDVTGDGYVAADDVVAVINYLNAQTTQQRAAPAAHPVAQPQANKPSAVPAMSLDYLSADLLNLLATDVAGQSKRRLS